MSGKESIKQVFGVLVTLAVVASMVTASLGGAAAASQTWSTSSDFNNWTLNGNTVNSDGTLTLNDANTVSASSPTISVGSSEYIDTVSVDVSAIGGGATLAIVDTSTQSAVTQKSLSAGQQTIDITSLSAGHTDVKISIASANASNPATVTSVSYTTVVSNSAPSADFVDSDNSATVNTGQNITLDASASTDADGDTLTYEWDTNGDGTYGDASGGSTVTISKSSAGTYSPAVRVSDGSATDTATFSLTVNSKPTISFANGTNRTVNVGENVTIDPTASDADGDSVTVTYHRDTDADGTLEQVGTGDTFTASFNSTGTYEVDVQAADSHSTTTQTVTIEVQSTVTGGGGGTSGGSLPVVPAAGAVVVIVGAYLLLRD